MLLSSEADSNRRPSYEKLTLRTVPLCALITVDSPRTLGSHNRTVQSLDPEAISDPLGENATQCTAA